MKFNKLRAGHHATRWRANPPATKRAAASKRAIGPIPSPVPHPCVTAAASLGMRGIAEPSVIRRFGSICRLDPMIPDGAEGCDQTWNARCEFVFHEPLVTMPPRANKAGCSEKTEAPSALQTKRRRKQVGWRTCLRHQACEDETEGQEGNEL